MPFMEKMNRILPDTQIFLWSVGETKRFSRDAAALLKDDLVEKHFSAVSAWEIAIKFSTGKLSLPESPDIFVPKRRLQTGFKMLPITEDHVLEVAFLPFHHKDPFDRLLIAQAIVEDLPILTADPVFKLYPVKIIDAEKYKAAEQIN